MQQVGLRRDLVVQQVGLRRGLVVQQRDPRPAWWAGAKALMLVRG